MPYFEEEEFDSRFSGKTLLRMMHQATAHWRWLVGFLTLIALVAFVDSLLTYLTKIIIDDGILAGDMEKIWKILLLFGAMIAVQAAMIFGVVLLVGLLGERIKYDLRKTMFDHLQDLSLSYFDRTQVGWIMARVTSDSERIARLITWGFFDSAWSVMSVATSIVFMLIINARLALIVLATVPILLYVAVKFKTKIIAEFRRVRKINSKITGAFNENISGVKAVKALCREERNQREFGSITFDMYRAGFRAAWLSALFLPAVQLITAVALGSIIWYSGARIATGAITIGGIQAFVFYVTFMMWPIQDLARIYAELQNAIASAERIFSLIDAVPAIVDRPGSVDPGNLRGEIRFDNVSFSYDSQNPVLQDFSLAVAPGETVALVGPTGGGKTTIANLICRFYEPTEGIVRIAGRDYREFTQEGIQSHIGVVLQDPHLFSGTIRENIRYGRVDATDPEVEEAARLSLAYGFIVTLGKGFDEEVGEGGNLLSVGQKQLISLARAMLARPDIFIMDEATSSIDTVTERLIQKGMTAVMKGRTSFVIAHRLSTIKMADRIVVIKDGRIEEMGNHGTLISARGYYYDLYTQQAIGEETVVDG
jgi:ATP-binding cassette subfamily B protein